MSSAAVIHLAVPALALDAVALGLLNTAVVFWALDLIKSLELPSGFKLEFQELRGWSSKSGKSIA
jgi:hypothetical protein